MRGFFLLLLFAANNCFAVATLSSGSLKCADFFVKASLHEQSQFQETLTLKDWGELLLRCESAACFNKIEKDFYKQLQPSMEKSHLLPELDAAKSWGEFIAISSAMSEHGFWVENYKPLNAVQTRLKQSLQDLISGESKMSTDKLTMNDSGKITERIVDLLVMNALNGVDTLYTFRFLNGLVEINSTVYFAFRETVKDRIKLRFNEARALEDLKISAFEFFKLGVHHKVWPLKQMISTKKSRSSNYAFDSHIPWWAPKETFREVRRKKQLAARGRQLEVRYSFQALEALTELEKVVIPNHREREIDLNYTGYWARRMLEDLNYFDGGGPRKRKKDKENQSELEFNKGLAPAYIPIN